MKLLITGSTGFLGQSVVRAALSRGHEVRAVVRPATSVAGVNWDSRGVEICRLDLRSKVGLVEALRGVDAVLHLAADKGGDLYAQLGSTVVGTENLLQAMKTAEVKRLVGISSFSVYDYLRSRGTLDERSPVEENPENRDAYCQSKLLQEQLIIQDQWAEWTVLRPGVIFGPGHEWTARLGFKVSEGLWVRTGAWARLPLTFVDNCADAVVLAAEREDAIGRVLNVVDDDNPTQRSYLKELSRRTEPQPRILPVSWTLMRAVAAVGDLVNRSCFGGRARVPQIFRPASLSARCKPLRYSNSEARTRLRWTPRVGLTEGLDRCFATCGTQSKEGPAAAPEAGEGRAA